VHLACDALGLAPDDGRGLTVTGGLPFSGGAGSNYLLHSIAAMVEVLRADPGSLGLVSGVGMHLTKHVFGLHSTAPPPGGCVAVPGEAAVQAARDAAPPTVIVDRHAGPATVASYTVAHGHDGSPAWGLVLADIDGGRAYGRVEDADLLDALGAEEGWAGRSCSRRRPTASTSSGPADRPAPEAARHRVRWKPPSTSSCAPLT
jgi:acetyl-CoA C-acetyltransferase